MWEGDGNPVYDSQDLLENRKHLSRWYRNTEKKAVCGIDETAITGHDVICILPADVCPVISMRLHSVAFSRIRLIRSRGRIADRCEASTRMTYTTLTGDRLTLTFQPRSSGCRDTGLCKLDSNRELPKVMQKASLTWHWGFDPY